MLFAFNLSSCGCCCVGGDSMYWNKVKVTVKRLHRKPPRGSSVDFLIHESEHLT